MNPIPSRFSKSQFDALAPTLGYALSMYPAAIEVDPGQWSIDSYARKFREVIKSKLLYGWKHVTVDEALWGQHARNLVVSPDYPNLKVLIGSVNAIRKHRTSGPAKLAGTLPETEIAFGYLINVCMLLAANALTPRPNGWFVRAQPEMQRILQDLEVKYEVGFVQDEQEKDKFIIV